MEIERTIELYLKIHINRNCIPCIQYVINNGFQTLGNLVDGQEQRMTVMQFRVLTVAI